jgi:phage gp29-like protein
MADNFTLYDAYNRPIRQKDLTREIATASLTGIRTVWNHTVASGLTPDRLAGILRGAADGDHDDFLTLAEEMEERDLHYACELGKRKLAVSRLPVTVESVSDSARDTQIADAVRDMVKKSGFRWLLKDLLDALGKGFAAVEILWDRSGATWRPAGYEHRDPRWFCWDRVSLRKLRLRDEASPMDGVELAPYKFLVHTPRIKSGIPIRGGYARLAAWAYMCKGYTVKDWLAFAEVFGMPLRLGKYGAGAKKEEIDILKMAVANLGTDAAAVFPQSMEIELVEASKSGSTDFFERLAQYLDNQVTKGILGQTATTQGTPGKLGNEEAQNEVRHDFRDDDAEQLEETLQRDLVVPYIDLNFGPQENYPQIQLRAPQREDIAGLSESLSKLVPLGLRVSASVIRDKLGLPDPDEGEEVLMPAVAGTAENPTAMNRQAGAEEPPDEIDATADEALDGWVQAGGMDPIMEPIARALDASDSVEAFTARLEEILRGQYAGVLVEHLATALFKARAMGAADEG